MHLPHDTVSKLLDVLHHLYRLQPLNSFFDDAVHHLAGLIRGDGCAWTIHRLGVSSPVFKESTPVISTMSLARVGQLSARHPFVATWRQMSALQPLMLMEFPRRVVDRHVGEFHDVYREMGLHNLTVPLQLSPTAANAVSYRAYKRAFTEVDRFTLQLLQPHLRQAYANAQRYTTTFRRWEHSTQAALAPGYLTPRETQVAYWLTQGKSNWEIGRILGIASRTAEKHVEHLLRKLQVENRTSAAAMLRASAAAVSTQDPPGEIPT